MLVEKLKEVMSKEGAMAIVAKGDDFPHVVNTWHSYVHIVDESKFIVPVAGMNKMEKVLSNDNRVLVTVGSKEVEGLYGMGAGFLIEGTAKMITEGDEYAYMQGLFVWARAIMQINITNVTQTV